MIVSNGSELTNEPRHEIDADHRHLARRRGGEERSPAVGTAVEDGDAEMRQMWPGCDLGRPHGRGDKFWCDHERVAPVPVADQFGDRRERGSALAGTERRDKNSSVALVQIRRGSLLVRTQYARKEGRIHGFLPE